jgi:hypothetical protein
VKGRHPSTHLGQEDILHRNCCFWNSPTIYIYFITFSPSGREEQSQPALSATFLAENSAWTGLRLYRRRPESIFIQPFPLLLGFYQTSKGNPVIITR